MLAKSWKSILLIIAIIAILFNIISKIVRAPSLQKNLNKVIEENIVSFDSAGLSNTIDNAGRSITNTAKDFTSTLFNCNKKTNEVTNETEEQKSENQNVEDEQNNNVEPEKSNSIEEVVINNEETTNTEDNSRFKVRFND